MPQDKFVKIVGYSSEDPKFPASNLINSKGKWKTKEAGEKKAWVIIQLDQLTNITHIDLGNMNSALIEVQVGRVGMDPSDFPVLLPSSSFMSPEESLQDMNTTRVRMFFPDKLVQSVAKEKWNLLKVVCSQPFNKRIKYGLSFVSYTGTTDEPPKPLATPQVAAKNSDATSSQPGRIGAFKLKADKEDDLSVGSYFNRMKRTSNEGVHKDKFASVTAEMKSERTLASLVLDRSRKEDLKRKLTDQNTRTPNKRANHDLPKRDQLPGEDEAVQLEEMGEHEGQDEEEEKKKREKERQKEKERKKEKERQREKERLKEEERRKEKQRMKDKEKQKEKERQREKDKSKESSQQNTKVELPVRLKKYAAFDQLFSGVVFTISGFQNPLRGEIRSKALKMGAEYKGDWGAGCTHLVCAFPNTPKFNQVKGKGKIVKKDWIEESHKRRVRLNWKSYSLTKDPSEESEDEVYEGTPGTPSNSGASAGSGCPAASISGTSGPASTASSSISGQSIQQQETSTSSSSRQINEDENTDDEIERIMEEEKRKEEMQKQQNEKEVEKEKEKLKKKETDKKGERTKNNLVHNNDSFNESEDTDEELKEEAKEVGRRKKEKAGKSLFGDTSSTDDEGNSGNQVAEQRRRRSKSKKAKKRKSSDSDAAYEAETDKENNSPSGSDDAYNAETDVDEDNRKEVLKRIESEPLINFKDIFKDDVILLKGFEEKEHQLLDRYIVAYGGSVALYNEPRVGIILTKSVNAQQIKDAESVNPSVEILAPEWIFKCVDEQARVSTRGFRAKEA